MTTANDKSRIARTTAADSPGKVAQLVISRQLQIVRKYLPLASKSFTAGPEYLHQLRVASRRASAAIYLFSEFLPRKASRKMRDRLKQLRRCSNDARDCDVTIQRLELMKGKKGTLDWLKKARRKRKNAQSGIVKLNQEWKNTQEFSKLTRKLLKKLDRREKKKRAEEIGNFDTWAKQAIRPAIDAFFAAVPKRTDDVAALHELRIQAKRLRYQMEIVAPAFPNCFRTQAYRIVEAVQDRLGALNDLANEIKKLRKTMTKTKNPSQHATLKHLRDQDSLVLAQAKARFWSFFSEETSRSLRHYLLPKPSDSKRLRSIDHDRRQRRNACAKNPCDSAE